MKYENNEKEAGNGPLKNLFISGHWFVIVNLKKVQQSFSCLCRPDKATATANAILDKIQSEGCPASNFKRQTLRKWFYFLPRE